MHSVILALVAAAPVNFTATLAPHAMASGVPQSAATLSPEMQSALANYAQSAPKTAFASHFPWLARLFAGAFIFSALLMLVLLSVQTSKQEGLGSSIVSASAYRRRPGREQQLASLTTFAAVLFVISATLVSLCGF